MAPRNYINILGMERWTWTLNSGIFGGAWTERSEDMAGWCSEAHFCVSFACCAQTAWNLKICKIGGALAVRTVKLLGTPSQINLLRGLRLCFSIPLALGPIPFNPPALLFLSKLWILDLWPPESNQVISKSYWIFIVSFIRISQAVHETAW